jgi:hypothetical protein
LRFLDHRAARESNAVVTFSGLPNQQAANGKMMRSSFTMTLAM